ncbi:MAG: HD domain-containing protein, partial [Parcubacteria group bacterium]|nr:HD domain-containing protein [Parcubacteria group bacterium]
FLKALVANPLKTIELYEKTGLLFRIIPELQSMKNCPQPPEYHSEGDVWTHALMALEKVSSDSFKKFFKQTPSAELIFTVLLHDIGKPPTLKTPERDGTNRIRFDGHDLEGSKIAEEICKRLRVDAADMSVSTERIVWLIRHHLFTLNTDLEKVKKTTIEKYFFNPLVPGETLLQLTFADASAAIPRNGIPDLENLKKTIDLIRELAQLKKERKTLPPPLLNGNEIMEILKIKEGAYVGKIINELREAQLSKKIISKEEAEKFIQQFKK